MTKGHEDYFDIIRKNYLIYQEIISIEAWIETLEEYASKKDVIIPENIEVKKRYGEEISRLIKIKEEKIDEALGLWG